MKQSNLLVLLGYLLNGKVSLNDWVVKAAVPTRYASVLRITYLQNTSEALGFISYEVMEASSSEVNMIKNVHIVTL